jgi:phage terminase large subunit
MIDSSEAIFRFPRYFKKFEVPARYNGISGGRGSAKTTTVSQYTVARTLADTTRVLCCREIQKSIASSTYESIKKATKRAGVYENYRFRNTYIEHKKNDSLYLFMGLRTNADQVMSIEDINICWIDQAETISHESLELLTPSIRADDSEVWATWNNRYPSDAIIERFKTYAKIAIHVEASYLDNPYFNPNPEKPSVLEQERRVCEKEDPEAYKHIWLGGYREANIARVVLPYTDLKQCVGAAKKLGYDHTTNYSYMGLDVADGGEDKPAWAIRQGSLLIDTQETQDKNTYELASTVLGVVSTRRIARCYYDATGVGAGIKADFYRLRKTKQLPFTPDPFLFGGAVQGKDKIYAHGIKNSKFFSHANAQGFWNLKLRLQNTIKALNGERKIDLDRCLFLPANTSEQLLRELSQIEYERDYNDKIKVIKCPNDIKGNKNKSPNLADAVMMSYARDLKYGLRAY